MGLLDNLLPTPEKTETERELERFTERRQYEREVFNSALRNWLLQTGLGSIMMEQTEEFARQSGLDGWPEQFDMYDRDRFDPRREQCREIMEYIND